MATIQEIANDVVALNREGNFDEALNRHSSPELVSIEASEGPMQRAEGLDQVHKKGEWWAENHEVHSATCEGPWINGDQFTVRYGMDVTQKESGQRFQMEEIGLYTVRDGKIVEERFFYNI